MKIIDSVYGEEEIGELVLSDLINSLAVQRLKEISQFGLPDEYHHRKGFSRYDHSIGVMILLRRLGANLDEQIAGLLHDVSHTAFSHVIDWVMESSDENYQDKTHLEFVTKTDIPEILKKHGKEYPKYSVLEDFSLLEKHKPSLCADRVDYTLRELNLEGKKEIVKIMLGELRNVNGQIVFADKTNAEIFGREYMRLQEDHWSGMESNGRYYLLSKILKKALNNKIISMEDLNKTDYHVLNILESSNDPKILNDLNLLKNFKIADFSFDSDFSFNRKFKHIDPEVFFNEVVSPLSEINDDYRNFLGIEKLNSENKEILILKER